MLTRDQGKTFTNIDWQGTDGAGVDARYASFASEMVSAPVI